jgi:hypothetical protein
VGLLRVSVICVFALAACGPGIDFFGEKHDAGPVITTCAGQTSQVTLTVQGAPTIFSCWNAGINNGGPGGAAGADAVGVQITVAFSEQCPAYFSGQQLGLNNPCVSVTAWDPAVGALGSANGSLTIDHWPADLGDEMQITFANGSSLAVLSNGSSAPIAGSISTSVRDYLP